MKAPEVESLNEREDYLDRLLRGVEDSPEDIQETEEDFLEESGIEIDSGKINRIIDNIN